MAAHMSLFDSGAGVGDQGRAEEEAVIYMQTHRGLREWTGSRTNTPTVATNISPHSWETAA